jgi:hypothetical protein
MSDLRVPAVIRGQVLEQARGGYLVRGQFVVGCNARRDSDRVIVRNWYWYDMYDRRHEGSGFGSASAALDHLAAFITEQGA